MHHPTPHGEDQVSRMLDRAVLPPHSVARWAGRTPTAVAVEHLDGRRLSYAELHADGLAWAHALEGLGVGAGSHVASLLPNGFLGHRTMLGLGWLRATEVPLNTAYVGAMLEHTLTLSDSEWLLTTAELFEQVRPLLSRLPKLRMVVLLEGSNDAPVDVEVVTADRFAAAVKAAPTDVAYAGPDCWDIATLLFTSGTTGPSKAVITPWGLAIQMWSWVPDGTLRAGEGMYCPLPLFHNSGRSGFAYAMDQGGRFVIRDRFRASSFWADVAAADCRIASLVGPMSALLAGAPPTREDADNPLRHMILGPMIPDMEAFEERFGVTVATCYGQTEVGAPIVTGWDHGPWQNTGSVRQSYPWQEIRLVDAHDNEVPDGEVGELIVRSTEPWSLNLGYYNMPEATVAAWRNGWFHTGDVFVRDAEGRYTFFDRRRDVLRRRGENISSFEVERGVGEHPAVVECVVVGVPSELGDDEVLAAVIVDGALDPAELIAFLSGRMPAFMIPRYVRVLPDFPRNATTGRVRKDELRALVADDHGWDRQS